MAVFVEKMSHLTTNPVNSAELSSHDTSISIPDSESDTGSVIQHDIPYHWREDSRDSQSTISSAGRSEDASVDNSACHMIGHLGNEKEQIEDFSREFAMVEEIHAPVETVPPPLEFQNHSSEDEEEELVTTVTEEYIVPLANSRFDFTASKKVAETVENIHTVTGKTLNTPLDSEHKTTPLSLTKDSSKPTPKPSVKEEFVLTSEDLSNVSLLPLRPKLYTQPKPTPVFVSQQAVDLHVDPVDIKPNSVHLAYVSNRGHLHSVQKNTNPSLDKFVTADMTTKEPKLLLRNVPEMEKSPLLMPLPAMRISGIKEPVSFSDDDLSSESSSNHIYRSIAKLVMGSKPQPDDTESLTDESSELSDDTNSRRFSCSSSASSSEARREDSILSQEELQKQYKELQEQFLLWQHQLQENQAILAKLSSSSGMDADSSLKTLQLQVQMQQKMMKQLQTSMQTLNLQQQEESLVPPRPQATVIPPPPPPPFPSSTKIMQSNAVKKQNPPPQRFQPQLDPREELMIAIRSFGGKNGLKPVCNTAKTRYKYVT